MSCRVILHDMLWNKNKNIFFAWQSLLFCQLQPETQEFFWRNEDVNDHVWCCGVVWVDTECRRWVTWQATVYCSDVAGGRPGHTYSCISSWRTPVCHWCKLQDSAHLSLSCHCRSEVILSYWFTTLLYYHNLASWLRHRNIIMVSQTRGCVMITKCVELVNR